MFILEYYIHPTWNNIVQGAIFPVSTTVSIKIDFWTMVRINLRKKVRFQPLKKGAVANVVHYFIRMAAVDIGR